jgi:DNA-binding NarL/FixJ family response regulator
MKQNIEILIVTRSVVLQQGLGALLESLPGITSVKAIRDLEKAFLWIEAHQPEIVLLDSLLLGTRPETTLEKIQSLSPTTQRGLLVDDVQQMNLMLGYAEAILIKGISPSALTTIVTNLLSEKGDLT